PAWEPNASILAVTNRDLYMKSAPWRFVFGMQMGRRAAIVSTKRLDPTFFGLPAARDIAFGRTEKMFVHYLGLVVFGYERTRQRSSRIAARLRDELAAKPDRAPDRAAWHRLLAQFGDANRGDRRRLADFRSKPAAARVDALATASARAYANARTYALNLDLETC